MIFKRSLLAVFLCIGVFCASFAQQVLRPGDVVTVTVAEETKLSGDYTITQTGLILMQFIGAVEVKGLSEEAAAAKIARTLKEQQILRTATVTVKIKQRDRLPVSYTGAVTKAGEVQYREGLRLSDIIELASPSVVADLTNVRITRADGTLMTVDTMQGANKNPVLEPGDRVFFPLKVAGREVTVLGAVNKPGVIVYEEGMTLSKAIEASGGYRSNAEKSRVVVKFSAGGNSVIDTNVPGTDIALSPGDQVTVPVRAASDYIYVRGAIAKPGLIPYSPGLTLSKAVAEAAPVEGARLGGVKLIRKNAEGKSVTKSIDLAKVSRGESADEPLVAGDIVDVPYPAKSYSVQDTVQLISLALLIYFLVKR